MATLKTKYLGTHECHLFRKEMFEGHHHLSLSMASSYLEIAKAKGYIQANQNLLAINDRLIVKDLNLSSTPEILKKFAVEKVLYLTTIAESFSGDLTLAYKACCEYIDGYGLTPPKPQQCDDFISACVARIGCPRWWKKKVFSKQRRTIEAIARDLG